LEPRFPDSEPHRTRTPIGSMYDAVSDILIWAEHSLLSRRTKKTLLEKDRSWYDGNTCRCRKNRDCNFKEHRKGEASWRRRRI